MVAQVLTEHRGRHRRTDKHGYRLTAKRCECELCAAYIRGYAAGQASKYAKQASAYLYEDDELMHELLP